MTQLQTNSKGKRIIAYAVAVSAFLLLTAVMSALLFGFYEQLKADREYDVSIHYHNLINEVQDFTHENTSLLSGFSAFIQLNEDFTDDQINMYLHYLLKDHLEDIKNVGIFKDTTAMWVYPIEGNEAIIGVNLAEIPEQEDDVIRVKENLETLFTGPVNLVQGGVAFIIRMPLVKKDDYWGMVSIVLKAEQAFGFIDSFSQINQVDYFVTHADQPDKVIYGNPQILTMEPLKFRTVDSLGGWDVYSVPKGGWKDQRGLFFLAFFFFMLIGVIISRKTYTGIMNYNRMLTSKIELEQKFIEDRFTGIYTREYFNQRVYEEFSQALRHQYPISLVYFDLDHFKNVNDTYGHATGDKVLLNVVACVKELIRGEDVFSRWGGDEFILLLPHTALSEAERVAERIRQGIEQLEISQTSGVSASIGCSQWVELEYLESWFLRTDRALYASKNSGKNKVTISDHLTEKNILVKVNWDKAWNCNHPIIDQEHKMLLDRFNSIIESALGKNTFTETLQSVDAFLHEIEQHFTSEISILNEVGYPNVKEHMAIHDALLRRVKSIYEKALQGNISPVELFTFISGVILEGHLKNEDVKYFEFVKPRNRD